MQITTEELREAAQQLLARASDLRAALAQIDNVLAPARSLNDPVVVKNIQQWDTLKTNFYQMIADAESAYKIIHKVLDSVDGVMMM